MNFTEELRRIENMNASERSALVEAGRQKRLDKRRDNAETPEERVSRAERAKTFFMASFFSGQDLKTFEDDVLWRAADGHKTSRVAGWSRNNAPTHEGFNLSDLLDNHGLIDDMNNFLNSRYGEGEFMIFNHNLKDNEHRMVLTVSWDKDKFANAEELLQRNRERSQKRQQRFEERKVAEANGNRTTTPKEKRAPGATTRRRPATRHNDAREQKLPDLPSV
jgi:hypothetical protein